MSYLLMFGSSLPPVVRRRTHVLFRMFGSSLPPVVCRRTHVLFTLCSVRLYLQLFVRGLVSYLGCLCLFACSGVQYIFSCVVFCFSSSCVLCTQCCQFLWVFYS